MNQTLEGTENEKIGLVPAASTTGIFMNFVSGPCLTCNLGYVLKLLGKSQLTAGYTKT
jgi:hypothetical protein